MSSTRGSLGLTRTGPAGSRKMDLRVDGVPLLVTSRDVIKALDLADGDPVDPEEVRSAILAEEPTWAWQRALALLGYRDRSSAELFRKLTEDGYAADTVGHVLERLRELDLLDDERFADGFVRTKVLAGWGDRRIANGLRSAGLERRIIDDALAACYPADDRARARSHVNPQMIRTQQDASRAAARLVRRGFSNSIAREVTLDALRETPDDGPHGHSS